MSKLNVTLAVFVCMIVVSTSVFATGTRKEFKEFEITSVDDIIVGKSVDAIWKIAYSDSETPVTVVKRKTIEGTEYIVYSKHFEVSYGITSSGFGTKEVRNSWSNVPKKINRAVINRKEFYNQKVLTPNKVNDETALGLIASYLPFLINDGYTHLLN